MNIPENTPFIFDVTHVDAEGQFLRIWAHTHDEFYEDIVEWMRKLFDEFDYLVPVTPATALPRTRCLVKSIDNRLLRAQIINFRADGMILVQFIDYGNVTYVPIKNIRLPNCTPEIRYILSLPEAAIPFIVSDVAPIAGTWMDEVVDHIRNILCKRKFQGISYNFNNHKAIKFSIMNQDFSQSLVKRDMAVYSPFLKPSVMPSSIPHQELANMSLSHASSQKILRNNSFKAIQLEIGSCYDVKISYVEDGPLKFSVQLIEHLPFIESMMRKINSQQHIHLQEPPIAGIVGLGKRKGTNQLFRVVLNSPGDTECKVYYVDYGQHETLSFNDIYQLPDEFITPNVYSIRFTLAGSTEWKMTQDMKDYFEGWVCDKTLKLQVCKGPLSPLVQYCELFVDGESVKERLIKNYPELDIFAYSEPQTLVNNQREIVFVSYVESTLKFFVQIERDTRLLDELMAKIEKVARNSPPLSLNQMHTHMPCIALYDLDKNWYRASILATVDNEKVRVFYVDYGNEEIVPLNSLRAIHPELVKMLPKQAIKCGLNGFLSGPVDKEITKAFERMALDQRLCLVVTQSSNSINIVDLLEIDNSGQPGRSITEKLMSFEAPRKHEMRNPDQHFKPLQQKNVNNNWNERDGAQGQSYRNYQEKSNGINSKSVKDRENDQIYENRSSYGSGKANGEYQNNRTAGNGYNNRSQNSSRGSSSDKDFLPTSRNDDRKNSYEKRSIDDNRLREKTADNTNQFGKWQNNNHQNDKNRSFNGENNINQKKYVDNHSNFDKTKSTDDLDVCSTASITTACSQDISRYSTSTPICTKIPSPNITVGATKPCNLIFYLSPDDFYVHLSPDYKELDKMMQKINTIHLQNGKILSPSNIVEDAQCIAQFWEDGQWYRAVIKSVENGSATVNFIDYGNTENVSFDKIKEIESEFLRLPAQAVHCKLFCPTKTTWTKEDSDRLFDAIEAKDLEAEFISEENSQYQVLIKEPNSTKYINELFINSTDLINAKNALRDKSRATVRGVFSQSDFADLNAKWKEQEIKIGEQCYFNFSYLETPDTFFLQPCSQQDEFHRIYDEIESSTKQPITVPLKLGQSVIAMNSADEQFYRAQIIGLGLPGEYLVEFVDYGDQSAVHSSKIYHVEKRFTLLPKQAVKCSLKDVRPVSGAWENIQKIENFFGEQLDCTIHELKGDTYVISMSNNGKDVASTLVEENLAVYLPSEEVTEVTVNKSSPIVIPRIDFQLLEGQTLKVKISSIEMVSKFYIQFDSAAVFQQEIDSYMASKNPELLRLPNEMINQNQAIECSLFDVQMSSKADESFKKQCLGKEVLIFVESVNMNKLSVRLFDKTGKKIKIVDSQNMETIWPVSGLPILSSKHNVIVTWINDSQSLWLQFKEHSALEGQFLDTIYEYYQPTIDKPTEINLQEGHLYVALSSDLNWYRARLDQNCGNTAIITLIDYGNIEEIPIENLRVLEPQFYEPHQLGVEVSLKHSLLGNSATQTKILEPLLLGKECSATLYNVKRQWYAELIKLDTSENLCNLLANMNINNDTGVTAEDSTIRIRDGAETLRPPSPIDEMREGNTYAVRVTHINSPHEIWLQRTEQKHYIEELQSRLSREADKYKDIEAVPEEKTLCICKSNYEPTWYRAEVLDSGADIISVRYIDFGSDDVIDYGKGLIKQVPADLQIPGFAVRCRLDLLAPFSSEWHDDTTGKVRNLVCRQDEISAVIVSNKGQLIIDLLLPDGSSICRKLIDEGLADRVQSPDQHEKVVEENSIDEEFEVDPRAAFVSAFSSVDEFWMQEDKWGPELKNMEDRLIVSNMLEKVAPENLKSGLLCIAHFPDDGDYYRARVIEPMEDGKSARVNYIDFGNSCLSLDLRTIPDDLASLAPLARKCRLAKPAGVESWPPGVNKIFEDISGDGVTTLLLDVLEETDGICTVKLSFVNGSDVAQDLLKKCKEKQAEPKTTVAEPRPAPIGQEHSGICAVSYAISPGDFWIHEKQHFSNVSDMSNRMLEANEFEPIENIEVGRFVAAKYEDGNWYRSQILSKDDKGTEVLYVDYGNTGHTVDKSELRELPKDLANIPPIADHCALKLPKDLETWTSAAIDKFIEVTDGGNAEFDFKFLEPSRENNISKPRLVELFINGKNIIETILEKNMNESEDSAFYSNNGQNPIEPEDQHSRSISVVP